MKGLTRFNFVQFLFVQPSPLHKSKNSPNHVYRIYFSSNKLFVSSQCRLAWKIGATFNTTQHCNPLGLKYTHKKRQETTEIGNHVKSTFESILSPLACLVSSNRLLAINYDHYSWTVHDSRRFFKIDRKTARWCFRNGIGNGNGKINFEKSSERSN